MRNVRLAFIVILLTFLIPGVLGLSQVILEDEQTYLIDLYCYSSSCDQELSKFSSTDFSNLPNEVVLISIDISFEERYAQDSDYKVKVFVGDSEVGTISTESTGWEIKDIIGISVSDIPNSVEFRALYTNPLGDKLPPEIRNIKITANYHLCADSDGDGYDTCDSDGSAVPGCSDPCDFADDDSNFYPTSQEVCDGVDNDGDEATADGSGETQPTCELTGGVCSEVVISCVEGAWSCDYGASYEETETTCNDDRDNDCDGITDVADSDCAGLCAGAYVSILTPEPFYAGFEYTFNSENNLPGDTVSYDWDIAGTNTLEESPTHLFVTVGNYNVSLTAKDGTCTVQATEQIDVSCGISLNINDLAYSLYPKNHNVTFIGTGTHAKDAGVSLNWDFGDGGTAEGGTSVHSYSSGGDYNTTLTGETTTCSVSEAIVLTIDEGEPHVLVISPTDGSVDIGEQVTFQEASVDLDGQIVKWIWDFGDRSRPWGFLGTSGNLPACYNYDNSLVFCSGESKIKWITQEFKLDADCVCLSDSNYIYPESVIESTTAPSLRLYSYSTEGACADYGKPEDRECEVTLTVTDNTGLTSSSTVVLNLGEEAKDPDALCEAKVEDSKSCDEGETDEVFSEGSLNCCCGPGMYVVEESSISQTFGSQTKSCSSTPPVSIKKKPVIPKNPIVPTVPQTAPESNYVTPKAKDVQYHGESINAQLTGKSSSSQAQTVASDISRESKLPVVPVIGLIVIALLVALGFAYKKGKLPYGVEDTIRNILGKIRLPKRAVPETPSEFTPSSQTEPVESVITEPIGTSSTPSSQSTDPLSSYVSQARGQGKSDEQIRSVLKAQGWPDDKIDEAMT